MRLRVVTMDGGAVRSWVHTEGTFDVGSIEHLADELRAHLLALGGATRASLVRRVARLLEAVGPVEEGRVEEVCRSLERRGDILGGPGGRVAAAPLRLVEAHGERMLVVGSLPTAALRKLLPGSDVSPGVGRTARVTEADRPALLAYLEEIGGRLLSAEAWSGLPHAPHADAAWLADLELRLSNEGSGTAAGLSTRWEDAFAYDPQAEGNTTWRWQRRATTEKPCLVRARQPGGWQAYGFGTLRGPTNPPTPFVSLSRDEARRTELAIDRAAGKSRPLSAKLDHGLWWVTLDIVLPSAEYRFLLALAEERREDRSPQELGFAPEAWPRVTLTLKERLGLRTEG